MRIICSVALFCFYWTLGAAAQQRSDTALEGQPDAQFTVVYTGRTLGYYRTPDQQPATEAGCPSGAGEPAQVAAFRRQIASVSAPKVLLATGDNFAPELFARSLCTPSGQHIPKDQAPWRGSDNVASFFRQSGFNAIVPGKLDFHYGPERLRQIAQYLASRSAPGTPVQMLASNIAVRTTVANPPSESPVPVPPGNYSIVSEEGVKFRIPKLILPYLRRFEIEGGAEVSRTVLTGNGKFQTQALRRQDLNSPGQKSEPQPRYKFAWLCSGEIQPLFQINSGCRALGIAPPRETTLVLTLPLTVPPYPQTGSVFAPAAPAYVCASAVNDSAHMTKSNTLCSHTFKPHAPYLEQPYATVSDQPLVIFGVVDPVLLSEIGELNYSWRNANPEWNTQLEIGDPHEALSQVMQACEADANCRGKRKILIAQMPAAKAQRLAAHLQGQFDVIIAQPDGSIPTRDTTFVQRSPPQTLEPLVLVPAVNYSGSDQQHLHVVSQQASIHVTTVERTLENRIKQDSVPLAERTFTGNKPLWRLMVDADLAPDPEAAGKSGHPDYRDTVVKSVLNVMRRYCKADVAFLQHRDLFNTATFAFEKPGPSELQEMLDRLLWKNDFVNCRAVSGTLFAQVQAESDKFDATDQDELLENPEFGRGLDLLGSFKDKAGNLVVDGLIMNPGNLYAVATTDYLGLGDTGYAGLENPSIPQPTFLGATTRLDEISALVCTAIAESFPNVADKEGICRKPINPQTYFDLITMQPYSLPGSLNAKQKLAAWARQNWANQNIFADIKNNPAEQDAQNKRVLSLRLDRADAGFQQDLHSLSETVQKSRFSGVQAPEPTAPERLDLTLDWLLRLTSFGKNVDRFVQADAEFEQSAVRQVFSSTVNGTTNGPPNEPYQLSQPKNRIGIETGITTRVIPSRQKNITGLKLLTSLRFETQLASPFLQFQASDGFLKETLPRNNALFGKLGLRYDGAKSWLEAGFQSGPFTQVSALRIGALSCDPGNITNCVSPDGGTTILSLEALRGQPFSVQSSQRNQSGVFLNARLHVPVLYNKFDYVIENSGTLFFNRSGDSSADTHYLEVITQSISVPVFGNLSLVPKLELFLFQNKVAGWHTHGYQSSISAQYRFDWHTGLRWGQAFRYPNPPQTDARQ